jgi:transcriptional regulator with XRE-family HTH domain
MRTEITADHTPLLDARHEQYLEWLVTPTTERTPRTQTELARQLGVDPTTLRRWEKKDWFKREWDRRVNEIQGSPERTQRLLDALYDKALGGDNKAAQLYLQATNRLLPAPTIINNNKASDLSDEELEALIVSIAEHQAKRQQPPQAV